MDVEVRPLKEQDLSAADHIFRLAFGTLRGLRNPLTFGSDTEYIRTRWTVDPEGSLGAYSKDELVGSVFATTWGSFGFLGPLSVHPGLWNGGIAKRLLEPTMQLFHERGIKHAGLFTLADSTKHLALYQKFGFWPRFLIAAMSITVGKTETVTQAKRYSEAPENERLTWLHECRNLTSSIYDGLDVEREIRAVHSQGLGDTILIFEGTSLGGFAVCHCGPSTEAGSNRCYVKFGAVRPGPAAEALFHRLLKECEAFAAAQGTSRLIAGVNTARHEAYRIMRAYGFRTDMLGVAMQKPNEPAYNRSDVYIIDDWR